MAKASKKLALGRSGAGRTTVGESRAAYASPERFEPAIYTRVKLSSKNQITLPVATVRALELKSGDELDLLCLDGVIYLEKSLTGDAQLDRIEGSMAHVPEWKTKESIHAWIRDGRDDNRDY
jgi:bifunctional DNA-binding transcriptional regulator/antitoxin component of YhaV-PrlF toxin-antitoxin module